MTDLRVLFWQHNQFVLRTTTCSLHYMIYAFLKVKTDCDIFFSSNKQDSRYFVKNTVEHKSEQGRLRISSTSLLYANLTGCVKISMLGRVKGKDK